MITTGNWAIAGMAQKAAAVARFCRTLLFARFVRGKNKTLFS
jgi:hypothetical protein